MTGISARWATLATVVVGLMLGAPLRAQEEGLKIDFSGPLEPTPAPTAAPVEATPAPTPIPTAAPAPVVATESAADKRARERAQLFVQAIMLNQWQIASTMMNESMLGKWTEAKMAEEREAAAGDLGDFQGFTDGMVEKLPTGYVAAYLLMEMEDGYREAGVFFEDARPEAKIELVSFGPPVHFTPGPRATPTPVPTPESPAGTPEQPRAARRYVAGPYEAPSTFTVMTMSVGGAAAMLTAPKSASSQSTPAMILLGAPGETLTSGESDSALMAKQVSAAMATIGLAVLVVDTPSGGGGGLLSEASNTLASTSSMQLTPVLAAGHGDGARVVVDQVGSIAAMKGVVLISPVVEGEQSVAFIQGLTESLRRLSVPKLLVLAGRDPELTTDAKDAWGIAIPQLAALSSFTYGLLGRGYYADEPYVNAQFIADLTQWVVERTGIVPPEAPMATPEPEPVIATPPPVDESLGTLTFR